MRFSSSYGSLKFLFAPQTPLHRLLRNSLAIVLAIVGATAIRYSFSPHLGSRVPFLIYVMAVAVAAQIAGTVSGLIVTVISIILIDYPAPASDTQMPAVLAIFGAVGATLSIFGGWQRRLRDQLHLAYEEIALKHEAARMGSYEWFVKQDRMEWSRELAEICGLKLQPGHAAHSMKDWIAVVHPEDRPQVIAAVNAIGQATSDQTYRIVRPDGEIRWVHSRRKYNYDADGKPLYVLGIIIDVSDLKQGEIAQQIVGRLLQVCSACRRIHDSDTEDWYSMEGYLRQHALAKVSHGMCPDCSRQWFPEARNLTSGRDAPT